MWRILLFLGLAVVGDANAQDLQYGSVDELCGTQRLFVDAGMYLDDGAFTHLNETRTQVLGRAELLKRPVPADPLERLGRLVELYELQRDLDFFWFGLTMLIRADDDVKRQRLESLSRGSAALAELATVAQKAVAGKLVEDVMDCRASKPK